MAFLQNQSDITIKALDNEDQSRGNSLHKEEILVSWSLPPEGWVLLNTDDAAKGNLGTTCGGGVFRGARGEWIGGFAEKMGVCTSTRVEMKAVPRGLRLAREKNITRLWIQSDSMVTVGILRGNMVSNAEYAVLKVQCQKLLDLPDWEVKISHCTESPIRQQML